MKGEAGFWGNLKSHLWYSSGRIASNYSKELDRQSNRVIIPAALVMLVAWLPYISTDHGLHPELPELFYFRIGLTIVAFTILMLRLIPRIHISGQVLLAFLGGYLQLAAAAITGLTGGDPVYMGGYLFVIMTIIIGPLRKRISWLMILGGLALFFTTAALKSADFSTRAAGYSIRDLLFTSLVAIIFVYILDGTRRKTYRQTKELEKEKNKLKTKNMIIEQEMEMARVIQESLIPLEGPNKHFAFFYKPMTQVGGDFYDFIQFRDREKVGIFISDVSGHRVPAALITSMIKSYIFQAGDVREDPAALFSYLNSFIFRQTGDNFITAFYGILDLKTGGMIYCNAGHNLPFLITEAGVTGLDGAKSLPLSVLRNTELREMNKQFENRTVVLDKKTKLLLYTDGLVEAVNIRHRYNPSYDVSFEKKMLNGVLQDLFPLPSPQFVHKLYAGLVAFRGCDAFEDDVCIICVDI